MLVRGFQNVGSASHCVDLPLVRAPVQSLCDRPARRKGVAATNLGGRVLADLITGTDSELTRLPMVNHHSRDWEPEPFRFLAARYLQHASLKLDARARPLTGRTLTERLIGH